MSTDERKACHCALIRRLVVISSTVTFIVINSVILITMYVFISIILFCAFNLFSVSCFCLTYFSSSFGLNFYPKTFFLPTNLENYKFLLSLVLR